MREKVKLILFTTSMLLCFVLAGLNIHAQELWSLTHSEEGIRIFEQSGDKYLKDVKLVYEIEADIPNVVGFLLDKQGFRDMIGNIQKIKMVKKINDSVRFYYLNIGVDPFINRDAIVKVTLSRESCNEVLCEMKLDNSIGYDLEHTEVKPFVARWSLQSLGNQRLQVNMRYSGQVDDYPDWVIDILESLFREQLINIANQMQSNIKKERYQYEELSIW